MNAAKLLVALIFLSGMAQAANDLYKWTDEKGVPHYSDIPPPSNIKAQRVHVDGGLTSDRQAAAADAAKQVKDAQADPKAQAPKPPVPIQETPEFRARLCDQSKANLELLQSKIQVGDAQGKPLDDKTRESFTQQSQRAVAANCTAAAP
jgi:ribonuclease D